VFRHFFPFDFKQPSLHFMLVVIFLYLRTDYVVFRPTFLGY